jgi:hypothetical protein
VTGARDPDRKRCTHKERQRDGTVVECSDAGTWKLDRKQRTWRPADPKDRSRRCWAHGPGSERPPIGRGGRRRAQPNARLQRVAALVARAALEVTKALQDVDDELSMLGFPSSSSRGVGMTNTEGPVSRDALRIQELTDWREETRDAIADVEEQVDWLIRILGRVRNVRHAHGVRLCAENQQGRAGSIDWGDPTCTEIPTKGGLCSGCYQRERRWRGEHGMPTSEAPAA